MKKYSHYMGEEIEIYDMNRKCCASAVACCEEKEFNRRGMYFEIIYFVILINSIK